MHFANAKSKLGYRFQRPNQKDVSFKLNKCYHILQDSFVHLSKNVHGNLLSNFFASQELPIPLLQLQNNLSLLFFPSALFFTYFVNEQVKEAYVLFKQRKNFIWNLKFDTETMEIFSQMNGTLKFRMQWNLLHKIISR